MMNNAISRSEVGSTGSPSVAVNQSVPLNVWVVDDNRDVRGALVQLLGYCEGLKCTASFHSPNAVLSALASKAGPDVILLDIQMGEANGLDAIRPIKALSRSTQVLMFTTCADRQSRERAFRSGATDFLLKHYSTEQILESIQRATKNPAPHLKLAPKADRPPAPAMKSRPSFRREKRLHWLRNCLGMLHGLRN